LASDVEAKHFRSQLVSCHQLTEGTLGSVWNTLHLMLHLVQVKKLHDRKESHIFARLLMDQAVKELRAIYGCFECCWLLQALYQQETQPGNTESTTRSSASGSGNYH